MEQKIELYYLDIYNAFCEQVESMNKKIKELNDDGWKVNQVQYIEKKSSSFVMLLCTKYG